MCAREVCVCMSCFVGMETSCLMRCWCLFAAGKTPDPEKRTYIDVMHERDLRREEAEVRGKIIEKKKESTAAEKQDKEKPGNGSL